MFMDGHDGWSSNHSLVADYNVVRMLDNVSDQNVFLTHRNHIYQHSM